MSYAQHEGEYIVRQFHPAVMKAPCRNQDDGRTEAIKPRRPIELRREGKGKRCAGLVPHAVIVASAHTELVIAGRQLIVNGGAACFGVDPLVVKSFEFVLKPDFFRRGKAERGEIKSQFMRARWKFGRQKRVKGLIARANLFDEHRR